MEMSSRSQRRRAQQIEALTSVAGRGIDRHLDKLHAGRLLGHRITALNFADA
jgi:hypothetical protein